MAKFMTLADVYGDDYPEENERIWNFVGQMDFNETEFAVVKINPVEFASKPNDNNETVLQIYYDCATDEQKELIEYYQKTSKEQLKRKLVVVDDVIIDGWHRLVAFALAKITQADAVNLGLPK